MNELGNHLVDAFQAALLQTDATGKVLSANEQASRLLGRDLTGAALLTDTFADDLPLVESIAAMYRQAAAGNTAGRELIAATDESGSHFYWMTVTPTNDTAAQGGRLVCLLDISSPLMEAPGIRKVFSQVSHDLRSPLTSVAGAAELLLSGRVGAMESVQRRLVTIVEDGARKMSEILSKTRAELVRAEAAGAGGEGGE